MSGPENDDFFNLEKPQDIKNTEHIPNFGFEIRNAPELNSNAAKRVETAPQDMLKKGQDGCFGEIAKNCSWLKKDGTNSQSGSIGKSR